MPYTFRVLVSWVLPAALLPTALFVPGKLQVLGWGPVWGPSLSLQYYLLKLRRGTDRVLPVWQ